MSETSANETGGHALSDVERVAREIYERGPVAHLFSWQGCSQAWRDQCRETARLVIAADGAS